MTKPSKLKALLGVSTALVLGAPLHAQSPTNIEKTTSESSNKAIPLATVATVLALLAAADPFKHYLEKRENKKELGRS